MQAQTGPQVGAATTPWTLLHWLTADDFDERAHYHTHGVPEEGTLLRGLRPDTKLASSLAFPLGQQLRIRVTRNGEEHEETWTSELDFHSRLWLVSRPSGARLRLYRSSFLLIAEAYEGPRDTALHRLYHGLARFPFAERGPLEWTDRLEINGNIDPLRRLLAELALPVKRLAWLESTSTLRVDDSGRHVVTTQVRPRGPLALGGARRELRVIIDGGKGLRAIEEHANGELLLRAEITDTGLVGEAVR